MQKLRLLSFYILVLFSCDSKLAYDKIDFLTKNNTDFEEKILLQGGDLISLKLDKETGFRNYSARIDNIKGHEYLSFINRLNNSIYVYDLSDGSLRKKIQLENEGEHDVGSLNIAAHYLVTFDSTYLYNAFTGRLFLLDSLGKVKDKGTVVDYGSDVVEPNPEPSTMSPILVYDNSVYFSCSFDRYLTDYSGATSVAKYDLKERKTSFMIPLSEKYNSGYWGDQFKYNPSVEINRKNQSLIVSFPIDPDIHVYDLDGNFKSRHYESSKRITSMSPMKADISFGVRKDHSVRDNAQLEYSLTNSDYRRIIFDPDNDLYYRVAYVRPSVDDYRLGKRLTNFSISILDSKFNKLGEKYFDSNQYSPSSILLSSQGILIARSDLYASNEDEMTYEILKVSAK